MDITSKTSMNMNTSLKNARIFDDDSWDAESAGFIIKKEPYNAYEENVAEEEESEEKPLCYNNKIKEEIADEAPDYIQSETFKYPQTSNYLDCDVPNVKQEMGSDSPKLLNDNSILHKEIKQEAWADDDDLNESYLELSCINNDVKENMLCEKNESNESWEENYLDKIDTKIRVDRLNTPIKKECVTDDSNPSPFNKELFTHFNLKQEEYSSPEARNGKHRNLKADSRKSVKKTVFSRVSPYKKYSSNETSNRIPVKKRLDLQGSSTSPRRKARPEMETDPIILARRQKQIDFGKNTIGYDNFIKSVPRAKRTLEDPKTPNKMIKYSRRGWDGLIKQWRLRLHKYDPEDSADA